MSKKKIAATSKVSKRSAPRSPIKDPPTVDRVLIALQKTLSRVSRDSAGLEETQAQSLIVGSIAFELELRCSLVEDDKLALDEANGSPLKLSGEIVADVGVRLGEEVGRGQD